MLVVVGAIVWGGGSLDQASASGPSGPGGEVGIPGSAGPSVGIPGSAGASGSDGEGLSPEVTRLPLDPTVLGPSGASVPPTGVSTILQWRLPGNWQDQLASYQGSFPAPGYELFREPQGGTTDEAGNAIAVEYQVIPIGGLSLDQVGYLRFEKDPDDPEGSTLLMWSSTP